MIAGEEITRCPQATLLSPEADDLARLYHEGHLGQLSALERRRAPAKLMAALVWADEVWRDHQARTKDDAGSR